MRIASLTTEGSPELSGELRFPESGPLVVHAPRGDTKSRLLQLIAAVKEHAGPYGVLGGAPWPPGRAPMRVRLELALNHEERDFAATTSATIELRVALGLAPDLDDWRPAHGLSALLERAVDGAGTFELVPAERSLLGSPPGGMLEGRLQRMLLLSSHVKKYASLPARLADLARDRGPAFAELQRALAVVAPHLRCVGSERGANGHRLAFRVGERPASLEDLGKDEHQYLLFAALAVLPRRRSSVLLIDEPELHMSEAAAGELIPRLVELFGQDNQLVFGTRSEAVARSVPPSARVSWGG